MRLRRLAEKMYMNENWRYIPHFDHYRYKNDPTVVLQFKVIGVRGSDNLWYLWTGNKRHQTKLGPMDVKEAQVWASTIIGGTSDNVD
jgi:hypothetical protein